MTNGLYDTLKDYYRAVDRIDDLKDEIARAAADNSTASILTCERDKYVDRLTTEQEQITITRFSVDIVRQGQQVMTYSEYDGLEDVNHDELSQIQDILGAVYARLTQPGEKESVHRLLVEAILMTISWQDIAQQAATEARAEAKSKAATSH